MIAAIELAVLDRLAEMEGPLGFAWKRREVLPEDWEAYLADLGGQLAGPAAWIGFTGWSDPELIGDQLFVDGSFGLVVASTSDRQTPMAARHGGPDPAKEPGSYRLALGAAAVLEQQMLGLDLMTPIAIGACAPVKRSDRMKGLNMSAHAMTLGCRFPIRIVGDGEPADLEALHANWDMPAFHSPFPVDADPVAPGAQLPDDPHADATDHIALQETDPS